MGCIVDCGVMKRDKRITLQSPKTTATVGADGHIDLSDDDNWTTRGSRWAAVITRGGREAYQSNQVQAEHSVTFELASDSLTRSIAPEWRIVYAGRKFQFVSAVDENFAKRKVIVEAVETK